MTTPTPATACANWLPDGTCLGVQFHADGRQYIDRELAEHPCLLRAGKGHCAYFAECVLGSMRRASVPEKGSNRPVAGAGLGLRVRTRGTAK